MGTVSVLLAPQALVAVALTLPLMVDVVTAMLLVVEDPDQPLGNTQV
jgi:hypothetical protein